MRVKKLAFTLLSLFFYFLVNSQVNLVSNPGFENYTTCPTFMLQWNNCIGWTNCNGNIGGGLWGTPDYYHTCGVVQSPYNPVPPNTGMGFCNPHLGNAMMGLACYNAGYSNAREYISTQLTCPLTPGNTYTVSFWITASSLPEVKYNSSHFGVYLSNASVPQSGLNMINVIPQYEITNLITNTNWQQHTFTISPTTNLNYITLGCFKPDAVITTSISTPSAWQPYSNYFIDDIEVLSSASSGTISMSSSSSNVTCFGGANGSATVTASGSGNSYLWSPGSYTTASVSNLSAGIYTVTVNNGGCLTNTLSVNVTQPSAIVSSISTTSQSVCLGQSIVLNAINSGGVPSYTTNWSSGSLNTNSITVTPSSTGVYSYTVTDANMCSKTASVSINVISVPTISINSQNVCNGVATTLTASGATNYTWFPGNTLGNSNSVTLTVPETYTIVGATGSCSVSSVFPITVNIIPTISVNSTSICSGETATLTAACSISNYTWMPGGQNGGSILVNPNATCNYSVISSINSCSAMAIATVVVKPLPILITTNTITVCAGQTAVLSVTGANTYTWLPGNFSGNTISISPLSNTQYTVLGEINGCFNSSIIQVNTASSLTVNVNSIVICEGDPAILMAYGNGNQYHWEPSGLAVTPNNNNTFVTPLTTTVFTLETSYNGNCVTTVTASVVVNDKPEVFAGNDTIISIGDSFVLTGSSSYNYGWEALDGTSLNCNYCSSVTVNPQENTCYVLKSYTSQGCRNMDTICVIVDKDWSIYIPNAFTPNNDLKNDLFIPVGYGIIDYDLYVFNRWGEQIFKSDEEHRGWDGYYKNIKCEMGVYTYMIIINTFSNQEERKIGHVTLLK